jgi:hypothetical protein
MDKMLENILSGLMLIAVIFCLPMLFPFVIALWEKRMVWPYMPIEPPESSDNDPHFIENNPYASPQVNKEKDVPQHNWYSLRAIETAQSFGFEIKDVLRDGKGKLYRVRYNFLRSPDRNSLVLIGNGTIAGIPVVGTHFFTFLTDNRCLVTIDNPASSLWDFTGLIDERCLPNCDCKKLHDFHQNRVRSSLIQSVQLPDDNPVNVLREFRIQWVDLMESRGWVRFLDPQRNVWRYNIKGAFIFSVRGLLRGFRRFIWRDSWRSS